MVNPTRVVPLDRLHVTQAGECDAYADVERADVMPPAGRDVEGFAGAENDVDKVGGAEAFRAIEPLRIDSAVRALDMS